MFSGNIILYYIVNQCRRFKELRLLECMQFIELHRINTEFHAYCRLHSKRTPFLKSNKLHSYVFTIIQFCFFKFFQQEFCIRLYYSIGTDFPCFSFGTEIGIIQIIVTVIHQISFKRSRADCFDIFRNESQKNIQHIPTTHFRLTKSRNLRLRQMSHFFFFMYRMGNRRSHRLLFYFLRSSFRHRSRHIIIIRINHHTLTYGHRDIKSIGIFYQHNILSPKSRHNTAPDLIQEAYFITYFHLLSI